MFGRRPDGRRLKKLNPMDQIMPYIMEDRNDAMNMFEDAFDCERMDRFIKEKAASGVRLTYMHVVIAALVRLVAMRPALNRFIVNGRIYARRDIWISFVVHRTLREEGTGTVIKLRFDGSENIYEVAQKIDEAVKKETIGYTEPNGTDKLMNTLMNRLPSPIVKPSVKTLMWMDKHGILPMSIVELSPFHTSVFLTNLKSLGLNHVFHHVYNFGTTGLFFAMGKEKKIPVVSGGEITARKQMGVGIVSDERFCDGLYFALSLRLMRKLIQNPHLLEEKLEKITPDIG